MSNNPYQAPQSAQLTDVQFSDEHEFYVVAKRKFMVLYVATLGFYGVYWAYKNWQRYKAASNEKVIPILRGIFQIFFTHSLFRKVHASLEQRGAVFQWSPNAHATLLVILLLLSSILDRMSMRSIGNPLTEYVSLALMIPLLFAYLKAQEAINCACGDAQGTSNDHFTGANLAWIACGLILWGLSIHGLLHLS